MSAKTKTSKWIPLTTEEAKTALAVARPAIAPCLCGCGESTKGRFFPGYYATHHQRLLATAASGTPAAARIAAEALAAFGRAVPEEVAGDPATPEVAVAEVAVAEAA